MREQEIREQVARRKVIVSFSVFGLMIVAVVFGFRFLKDQPEEQNTLKPLRKGFEFNERVFSPGVGPGKLAKTFPKSEAAKKVRVNGAIGLKKEIALADWNMLVLKANGDTLKLTLDELKKLPKTEITFDFKCIEGWSQVTNWGGIRFSDFLKHYGLNDEAALKYIGLATPDGDYYVGIDMPSAVHPQTILCYEMNGQPLPQKQGFPLRLIIPTKYGIKSLKRIGTLSFSDEPPKDYWAERGYDYFSGL